MFSANKIIKESYIYFYINKEIATRYQLVCVCRTQNKLQHACQTSLFGTKFKP